MMKILMNKIIAIISFLLFSNLVFSQGLIETPLSVNPVLVKKWKENQSKYYYTAPTIHDTLDLDSIKFLDDFSYRGPYDIPEPYPDTSLWLDNFVFINNDYGIAPPSIGVATFD